MSNPNLPDRSENADNDARSDVFDLLSATPAQVRQYYIDGLEKRAQESPDSVFKIGLNVLNFLAKNKQEPEAQAFLAQVDSRGVLMATCESEGAAAAIINMWMPHKDENSLEEFLNFIVSAAQNDQGLCDLHQKEVQKDMPVTPPPIPTDASVNPPESTLETLELDPADMTGEDSGESNEDAEAIGEEDGEEVQIRDSAIISSEEIKEVQIPSDPTMEEFMLMTTAEVPTGQHMRVEMAVENASATVSDHAKIKIISTEGGLVIDMLGQNSVVEIEHTGFGCADNPVQINNPYNGTIILGEGVSKGHVRIN